ncbi:MAG: hypothetical protein U9N11_02475 [Campylobacterota bacterium]|nr:hypothetical protein [Campylobacterota bacterium]
MSKWKWRLQSHYMLWLTVKYTTSLRLELWGETKVITSMIGETKVITSMMGGTEVSTSEGHGCL